MDRKTHNHLKKAISRNQVLKLPKFSPTNALEQPGLCRIGPTTNGCQFCYKISWVAAFKYGLFCIQTQTQDMNIVATSHQLRLTNVSGRSGTEEKWWIKWCSLKSTLFIPTLHVISCHVSYPNPLTRGEICLMCVKILWLYDPMVHQHDPTLKYCMGQNWNLWVSQPSKFGLGLQHSTFG